ncbi:hypothetical protein [Pseudomonas syringae]|uniref:hypothetical protein n=1 Tax=Pseudomonas syringae TaxID=317 RepID=UPI00245F803A|nr:hypothetical protein [Pseudomonas syringae]MDH4602394.1 hypothetical protein [Pseudomonas syringae pv. papulans]
MKIAVWFSFMVVVSLAVIVAGVQGNVVATFLGLVSAAGSAFLFMMYFVEAMHAAKPHSNLISAPETNTSNG